MSLFPKSELTTDFATLNKLIYGKPKSGKSTLASFMHDQNSKPPLFIASEDGHGALSVHRVRVTNWDGFRRLVTYLKENSEKVQVEHSCFVIDLVSDLEQMAATWVSDQKDVEYIGDLDHGKGWTLHKNAFITPMMELMAILPCVFITHATEKPVMSSGGAEFKQMAPQLGKKCYDWINGKVDLIMYITTNDSELPVVSIVNTNQAIAGSRYNQICKVYPFNIEDTQQTYNAIANDFAGKTQPKGDSDE